MKGIHLTASQKWYDKGGVEVRCPVTTEPNIVWRLGTASQVYYFIVSNDLSAADMVLEDSARIQFQTEAAWLGAKSLTLAGDATVLFDTTIRPKVFDRSYARRLGFSTTHAVSSPIWNDVVFDIDGIDVTGGSLTFSDAYSIKDGVELPLDIATGATVTMTTLPTVGTFRISGDGTLNVTAAQMKQLVFEDFTGKLILTGGSLSYLQLPDGCTPSSYELSGSAILALPATADWPAGMTVTTAGSSILYLPAGSSVDESKILGTKNYAATMHGIVPEPGGTVTVGAGETLEIAGDGYGPDTTIVLAGGALHFPIAATVASPISVTAASSISVEPLHEVRLTGVVTVDGALAVATTAAGSSVANMGLLVFAGGGSATANITCSYGQMEFRGGIWSFAAGMQVLGTTQCRSVAFTKGVKATFAAGYDDIDKVGRNGLHVGSGSSYPSTLKIADGAEVTLNDFRMLRIGEDSWANASTLIVDGAILKVLGYNGEFDSSGLDTAHLTNTGSDRCSRVKIFVQNGGVIETDRVLSSPPITHQVDGGTELEGLHLTLDGGTYRLGSQFGARNYYPHQHPNQLFGGAPAVIVGQSYSMTNTCEIEVTIGAQGATFDLSQTRPECTSFTNTVANLPLGGANKAYFPSGFYPNLGPRWIVNGALNVKGNGNQEFVINGLDPAVVKKIGADGVQVKIVGDNAATLDEMTLGAAGAGLSVETEAGVPKDVSVSTLTVAENGVYDATAFNIGSVTIGDVVFGADAVLAATVGTTGTAVTLPISGTVTLADSMYYAIGKGVKGGAILSADGGILPADGEGVTWTQAEGFRKGGISVSGTDVIYEPSGLSVILR